MPKCYKFPTVSFNYHVELENGYYVRRSVRNRQNIINNQRNLSKNKKRIKNKCKCNCKTNYSKCDQCKIELRIELNNFKCINCKKNNTIL